MMRGELGDTNSKKRTTAVENHHKWIDAAKLLECHSIRVNAFGEGPKDEIGSALVDGLGQLSEYAEKQEMNVLVENHGLYTSDADWIVNIIRQVNNPRLGTLPDFGNWCLNAKWGSTMNNKCDNVFDRYAGVQAFLPYAKGVSAKSYNFDEHGNDTIIDYQKMLKIVKNFGYHGYIGIEYEGDILSEADGIRATKTLIEKTWASLS